MKATAAGFNPRDHLTQLRGRGGASDYLEVKWRLVWLREVHPDAAIRTEAHAITPEIAVFKATVTVPTGGEASGYGSETPKDFGDFIEKAETKAIGRALAALGFGTQFAPELDEGERIVDAPVARPQRPQDAPNGARRTDPPRPAASSGGGPQSAPAAKPGDLAGKLDYASALIRNNGLDEAAELKPFNVSDIGALTPVLADRLIERLEKRIAGALAATTLTGMADVAERRDPAHWRA